MALLPADSRQHAVIAGRISKLARRVEAGPSPSTVAAVPKATAAESSAAAPSRWSGGAVSGLIGTLALAAWKFKFIAVVMLTKAKFLLLGLTKASTFFSMLLSVGVYWTVFGGRLRWAWSSRFMSTRWGTSPR